MSNRFQEALDFMATNLILTCKDNCDFYQMINEAKTTLQELIDNMKFVEEVQTPAYIKVQNENEKLEKALDKACEMIVNCGNVDWHTKEYWKEYLLKESEKE